MGTFRKTKAVNQDNGLREGGEMGNSSRFEIFLDCLWGLALLVGFLLLPLSFIAPEASGAMGSPALWLHAIMLVIFAYTYGLRLRRHLVWFQQAGKNREISSLQKHWEV